MKIDLLFKIAMPPVPEQNLKTVDGVFMLGQCCVGTNYRQQKTPVLGIALGQHEEELLGV